MTVVLTRSRKGHTPRPPLFWQYRENNFCLSVIICLLCWQVSWGNCLAISYRCTVKLSNIVIGTGFLRAKSPKYSNRNPYNRFKRYIANQIPVQWNTPPLFFINYQIVGEKTLQKKMDLFFLQLCVFVVYQRKGEISSSEHTLPVYPIVRFLLGRQ